MHSRKAAPILLHMCEMHDMHMQDSHEENHAETVNLKSTQKPRTLMLPATAAPQDLHLDSARDDVKTRTSKRYSDLDHREVDTTPRHSGTGTGNDPSKEIIIVCIV